MIQRFATDRDSLAESCDRANVTSTMVVRNVETERNPTQNASNLVGCLRRGALVKKETE